MINPSEYQFLSTLEKKVWDWLVKNDIPFETEQTLLAEAREVGSAVVDFLLPDKNIILRVMGSYWHSGLTAKARDEFAKERLLNQGYIVVDLWEQNLSDDKIDKTMRLALEGQEVL
jgi:very-short-patch-repair endonuclease